MLYLFAFAQFRTQNRCALLLELLAKEKPAPAQPARVSQIRFSNAWEARRP
jgi:hypothetical protein